MARKRKKKAIRIFKVVKGCNVVLEPGQEDLVGKNLMTISNGPPEARYEPGTTVREDEFPPQAAIGYFIARGALVATGVVKPKPEPREEEVEIG